MNKKLLIGLLVFAIWGVVSARWYVCNIQYLCGDSNTEAKQEDFQAENNLIAMDESPIKEEIVEEDIEEKELVPVEKIEEGKK
jgi:hypothetical protein